ncbi:unnamed protein product [Acanthoscelides obtectus]|uniref:Uncharacterized protein n=1 Tax=Acanthoscelides obtectus TaxID=200917 RepID=A0A9P0Q2N7_ACAOB|nr:unnamed protein product [Acanthoscelides obtectus]CAK1635459.1 hypothetical protein AOBTE_LOCUS9283 [Acanthoscelides obtectus]
MWFAGERNAIHGNNVLPRGAACSQLIRTGAQRSLITYLVGRSEWSNEKCLFLSTEVCATICK